MHEIRFWDNAIAYDGSVPSWGHRLMEQGHRVTSIGKLHYVDSDAKRNGFDEEILPLHIVNGVGDLLGLIMIRHGKWKYVHYVGLPPMLFDLEADPREREDLGRDGGHEAVIRECETALRAVVDPEAVDRRARADQRAMIEKHGGKDAILKRGTFRYSPPPGVKASYY